ncbi:aminotransferase class I/II-fold pyridoxal phosphate-dependent enzyme [Hahella ganghwensis]|uniref:aminotransferase class I/II-fold pyridoxal phosphate-dependent enzyme n=1 Tax=Hahella ganghwensis TaxID=286420 RepID=UPI0003742E8E|nr:aminotransferase class I/II-fold pyridoxal phosphate-dependent enzyme [Hahella ganghwensis]
MNQDIHLYPSMTYAGSDIGESSFNSGESAVARDETSKLCDESSVIHGGDLYSASRHYGIPLDYWIDLSTGINPDPYPVADPDPIAFQRLPYLSPLLLERASGYYGNAQLLPISGTQTAIQSLPGCLTSFPLLVPRIGYQEHALQWSKSGAEIISYPSFDQEEASDFIDRYLQKNRCCHLLVINPNNPTGMRFPPEKLREWADRLDEGCYLIVDEAFMDLTPDESVLTHHFTGNMVVLRSFGKFFGLAGIRLGFMFGNPTIRNRVQQVAGVWNVNGPAQSIAIDAFANHLWHRKARYRIQTSATYTETLFRGMMEVLNPLQSTHQGLFSSYLIKTDLAREAQSFLAERGILVRVINVNGKYSLLRTGLVNPADTASCKRIEQAVTSYFLKRK